MTSIITFDPPLGAVEHIHGGSPSHSQLLQGRQSLYIDFLFTAQLSAYDYENLVVRDGARLQIWTDIPSLEDDDGNEHGWREIEFVDPEALNREMSANRKISLQVSSEQEQIPKPEESPLDTHTLYLAVAIPSTRTREFSFTYRIVYSSGRTTWLGFYERNGAVIIHTDHDFGGPLSSRTIGYIDGLSMKGNWSLNASLSGTGFATKVDHAHGLQIATVDDMATTRIWALGKDRLLRHASMLILVPAPRIQPSQEKLAHTLSYILSASPGTTLSVSSNGGITVSGSGAVHMTIINCLREYNPVTVVEAALKHSDLSGNWTLVGNDIRSRTIILACVGNGLPIPAVVVSFGTLQANFTQNPISVSVETSNFAALFNDSVIAGEDVKEFALFSSSKSAMYVFNVEEEIAKHGHAVLKVDSCHPKFTEAHTFSVAPLYRLHSQTRLGNASRNLGRHWFAAILTSYRHVVRPKPDQRKTDSNPTMPANLGTITDPRGLLTPPPSPPLRSDVEEQNSSSAPFHLSRTSSKLSDTDPAPGVIPVNYAIRKRPVVRDVKIKAATTTAPPAKPKYPEVDTSVRASLQKAPLRGHPPVATSAEPSFKRAVPKPQRSSCLMWIFRIAFKCLFASVRVFLRVAFDIRIALAWGVGLVIRGPGFAWGLLWGAGARPRRLFMLSSMGTMKQSVREGLHHQRKLSSSDPPFSRSLSPTRTDNRMQTNPIQESRNLRDRGAPSVEHPRITSQEAMINAEQPLSSRGSENSCYPNETETPGCNSEEIPLSPPHESAVEGFVLRNAEPVDRTLSSAIPETRIPLLQLQSEQEDLRENAGCFYAEITPLHSNGAEIVEIVLLTVASSGPRNSEKDAQTAHGARNPQTEDFEIALLEKSISFLSSHHPHAEQAGASVASKSDSHTPIDIRPVGVHSMHLLDASSSEPPDLFTAAYSSIRDFSLPVLDQKNPGTANTPREKTFSSQYPYSGFVICYQLPRGTLDQEAGTIVVAVRSPEPLARQT